MTDRLNPLHMTADHLAAMCKRAISLLELKHFYFKQGYIAFGKPDR